MNVLVIGGSGYVGGLVLPLLHSDFALTVFDRNPPAWADERPGTHYVQGDVTDVGQVTRAIEGLDALLYMAMGVAGTDWIHNIPAAYDVNSKGVHIAMEAAATAAVKRAVFTSTLSVYDGHLDIVSGATDSEEVAPDPLTVYGHTKRVGELACRFVHRKHGLPVVILRLFHPVSREKWLETYKPGQPNCQTAAPDLARAFDAALRLEHNGFEIVHVTGDTTGAAYKHEKARRLLGWSPVETHP
jgi:nucleoside-diphosphate-sugar epimerase